MRWESFKSAALAVCIALMSTEAIMWRNNFCKYGGAFILAHILWAILITIDEAHRKERNKKK